MSYMYYILCILKSITTEITIEDYFQPNQKPRRSGGLVDKNNPKRIKDGISTVFYSLRRYFDFLIQK